MRSFITEPSNTGLDLIRDARSGTSLEIVVPVFNEESRIINILLYYKEFDIVLLDGGSTDKTVDIAIKYGATIYKREGESIGENHFVHYSNLMSKSGYCFYMMADELIEIENLREGAELLRAENSILRVTKVEWIYGEEPKIDRSRHLGMARGFRRGFAAYDSENLHDSLLVNLSASTHPPVTKLYEIHHLHVSSIRNEYGKFGRYLSIEVSQLATGDRPTIKHFRRFAVPILSQMLWRVWLNKTSLSRKIFKIVQLILVFQLAILCWIEQRFLPSAEEQSRLYASKYSKNR